MTGSHLAKAFDHYAKGRLPEARAAAQERLNQNPQDLEAQYLLGGIAYALGEGVEAETRFRAVLDGGIETAELLFNLGEALHLQGRAQEAAHYYRLALSKDDRLGLAHQRLGMLLAQQGRYGEAVDHLQKTFFTTPDAPTANNLGVVLQKAERLEEAEAWYRQALSIDPLRASTMDNLGGLLQLSGRLTDAIELHERAIAADPSLASARVNLANAFMAEGSISKAQAALRWALVMEKAARTASQNFLMCLNYDEGTGLADLYREHRRWGTYQETRFTPLPLPARGKGLPKPLKLGFVSADFKRHSVAYFLEPLLEGLDRDAFEVHLYADVPNEDEVSARFRKLGVWHDLRGLNDDQAARLIHKDGIHVLIDLAGHTAGNRLPVFVLKPAPVQATWLGYPATTGLSRIDARLSDAVADPVDEGHSERLIRLPGFLCYRPPEDAPEVVPPPALTSGHVTFGSFNALAKLSERDLALIGRILTQLPAARFLLKARPLADEGVKARLLARMGHHGIDPDRVELLGRTQDASGHLGLYAKIDIALDPVHYNGTATTCEALWMGVPVITQIGDRHASRVGASILARANLPQLIAQDADAYVALAQKMAADPSALASPRKEQRAIVARSPLCDKAAFAKDFEAAIAKLWDEP
jgi:predicted O-linked N-acetylglucosamine transferase (SPINDLY family)